MSLIETAIKKIQASAAAQAQTAVATDTAPKRKSAVKFEPIDPTTIRQFKRVAADPPSDADGFPGSVVVV